MFADVLLPLPLEGVFTYSVPAELQPLVRERIRVQVPLGRNKKYIGIITRVHHQPPTGYQVKDILHVVDDAPIILSHQLKLWQWISDYYLCPLGDVYNVSMPQGLKDTERYRPKTETFIRLADNLEGEQALHRAISSLTRAAKQQQLFLTYLELSHFDSMQPDNHTTLPIVDVSRDELINAAHTAPAILASLVSRGYLVSYEKEVGRLNRGGEAHYDRIKPLSPAQDAAYRSVLSPTLPVTLLHGVTSSGKTEIYIHLIRDAIEQGKQVLYLLPEIALTVQIMERLQRVFGSRLGIYHSKYSDAERVEIWQKQLSDTPYDVILGARSAVLLPFQRLGLVIIDEEHETSFKQQDPAPRYHARSVALMLARQHGAHTVLGTATPSLESYYNAVTGKYQLVELTERFKGIQMPEIQVVDIADLQRRRMMNGPFSPLLLSKVREALAQGQQAILFQNRRGFAPVVECKTCGWVPHCQNCDVSMTYHRLTNSLTCHYCGFSQPMPAKCPCCEESRLQTKGYGTEKIEAQIQEILPEARIARMDLDTTRSRTAYERIINDFAAGRTNLLIGTQMVSKGLDFGGVSVVGILNADSMLNYPDFRAYEHSFQMMSQVAGRAGRKTTRGLVILQTRSPKLPVIRHVVANDYKAFYTDQTSQRSIFRYPPFYRLIYLVLRHSDQTVVEAAATTMSQQLRYYFSGRVLGPDMPNVARVNNLHIRQLILKLEPTLPSDQVRTCLRQLQTALLADPRFRSVQFFYDVDPS